MVLVPGLDPVLSPQAHPLLQTLGYRVVTQPGVRHVMHRDDSAGFEAVLRAMSSSTRRWLTAAYAPAGDPEAAPATVQLLSRDALGHVDELVEGLLPVLVEAEPQGFYDDETALTCGSRSASHWSAS